MFTALLILGTPMLIYGIWFIAEAIRYIRSGEYEVHQRLQKITR